MQYGKIVNGELRKAPRFLTYDGCNSDSHPAEVYLKFGYKPIVATAPPSDGLKEQELVSKWIETEHEITQIWEYKELPDDFSVIYRQAKRRLTVSLLELKSNVMKHHHKEKNSIAERLARPFLSLAFKCLSKKYPGQTISEAMAHYRKRIPANFFQEIGMHTELLAMGYKTYGGISLFVTRDGNHTYDLGSDEVNEEEGTIYCIQTGEELWSVPPHAFVLYEEDEDPIIIDPFIIAIDLMSIAGKYDSAYGNCMMYNMAYCYLHTIMDEFLTSTLSFYMHAYPAGAGFENEIPIRDVIRIRSIDELRLLQYELIEKRIASLGHGCYQEKVDYLQKRGVECTCAKELWFDEMIWFCEKRNALVHNAGTINAINLAKLKSTRYYGTIVTGQSVLPTYQDVLDAIELVDNVCKSLYASMQSKFSL